MTRPDPSSFSDSRKIRTTSLHVVLAADLTTAVLTGHVDMAFDRVDPDCHSLVLDSKDLAISQITDSVSGQDLSFELKDKFKDFGSALTIDLKPSTTSVTIKYASSPEASGVQVLSPEQTLNGEHPFLFTQNQAIHARSIVPCQDTPGVKAPYTAQITVAKPLVAVMSAVSTKTEEGDATRTFFFDQKIPIPAYLIAIVIGDIVSREISPRVRVWSERANIDACEYEFATTEEILLAAESVAGPYVWGRYDLLVLPPSFPYGGMENPCLTFVTPTLLAGDRSLVNVVAHEIAHSWTGNLVTNANWEHFWLNEGFTVFLERKILAVLAGDAGEKTRQAAALNGLSSLRHAVELFGSDNPLTSLIVNLDGVDPDDAFSSVPYEKGCTFLFYLESLVGGPIKFDPFLKSYIAEHAYKSIKSDIFVNYFKSQFPEVEVDFEAWLNTPGMPLTIPEYDGSLQESAEAVARKWGEEGKAEMDDISSLTSNQISAALTILLDKYNISTEIAVVLNDTFKFGESKNCEIIFSWCRVAIKARYDEVVPVALAFITRQGRMKYVRPLYRDLLNWKEHSAQAVATFEKHRKFYHNICSSMVAKDIAKATGSQ